MNNYLEFFIYFEKNNESLEIVKFIFLNHLKEIHPPFFREDFSIYQIKLKSLEYESGR